MRVKQADLATFVQQTLQNVRAGFAAAYGQGIDMIPEMEITFDCDVIQNVQALTSATTTTESGTGSKTEATPQIVDIKAETLTRNDTTNVSTSGSDTTNSARQYDWGEDDGSNSPVTH